MREVVNLHKKVLIELREIISKNSGRLDLHKDEHVPKELLVEISLELQHLSSKLKGSKNRAKARKVVARLHKKIANQRADFNFKLAIDLVRKYDYLFFEDLNLSGMNKLWGRKMSDLSFCDLLLKVKFKSAEHGKVLAQIPRFYPSSKTCSSCLNVKEELSLKERVFSCSCGHEQSRDLNAAINILSVGASTLGLDGVRPMSKLASIA